MSASPSIRPEKIEAPGINVYVQRGLTLYGHDCPTGRPDVMAHCASCGRHLELIYIRGGAFNTHYYGLGPHSCRAARAFLTAQEESDNG